MKGYVAVVLLGLGIAALFGLIVAFQDYAVVDFARAKYHAEEACEPCYKGVRKLYQITVINTQVLSWYFYTLVGLILLLEWAKPVYAKLSVFSVAFCHDFLWVLLDALFMGVVIPIYQGSLNDFYHSYLNFASVEIIAAWPVWGQIVIAVLVADFIRWFHHLLRHKVILFWCFHTVHHSQRDMNLFTDLRVHPVERLIEASVAFIPFLSLRTDVAVASLSGWFLFGSWYARFYHSNIKTNLGVLRYILVTPQSHRIHHSRKMAHQGKNFGAIFSIWDYLFGTQYRKYEEYPETGLETPGSLHETELSWRRSARTFVIQLVYPFQMAFMSKTGMTSQRPNI
jgi:sterol desaturase/sphingolipid hydroxylase (fatty acid hydroxylase superfamily)